MGVEYNSNHIRGQLANVQPVFSKKALPIMDKKGSLAKLTNEDRTLALAEKVYCYAEKGVMTNNRETTFWSKRGRCKGLDRTFLEGVGIGMQLDPIHNDLRAERASIMFNWANDIMISGLTSINSQLMHLVINSCNNVMVSNVKIIAPDNSPNIDGIHVQGSTGVTIKGCNIRTGDDCVSIGPGTSGLWMERIKCGPRHGTSGVKISDVTYKNIVGTLATKVAATFDCSPTTPCSSIMLQDVKLDYLNNAAQSLCKNIRGSTRGVIKPNKHEKDSEREKVKESKHQEEFTKTICMKKLAASAKIIIVLPALSHPQYQGFCGSGGAHLDLGRIHGFCFLKRYLCAAFRAHDISTSSGCFIVSEGVASIKTMGPCLRGVIPSYNHHHQHLLILGVFQPPARWDSFTTLSCMTYENHGLWTTKMAHVFEVLIRYSLHLTD
ncbi:hypothetical protein LguiB_012993 [Lonicera macranthoides]